MNTTNIISPTVSLERAKKMSISNQINALVQYALNHNLISEEYIDDSIDKLCHLFKIDVFSYEPNKKIDDFLSVIEPLLLKAYDEKLFEPNISSERDAFEAKLMDLVMPSPIEVKEEFKKRYQITPNQATDYLFKLSSDVNYIKTIRLKENISWDYLGKYGTLQMTINLAKPEKDPKEIALAQNKPMKKDSDTPLCVLCKENEQNYDNARMNLRIAPIKLANERWHFQYSPYQYYHEHAIILHDEHRPMKICHLTFEYLLDFVDMFPDYFIGSNADLPIVGGSILNHDHFQAGKHRFPIEDAEVIKTYQCQNDLVIEHIKWPLSTIRLTSKSKSQIAQMSSHILDVWKDYEDSSLDIIPYTKTTPHQTITPILRKSENVYVMNLVLRNNRTSPKYPDGIFHPHADVHHIKKENIGLIEAMGLAILPGRLKEELDLIYQYLNKEIPLDRKLEKHQKWISCLAQQKSITHQYLLDEVGKKFERGLEDSGVFKLDYKGIKGVSKLIDEIIKTSNNC